MEFSLDILYDHTIPIDLGKQLDILVFSISQLFSYCHVSYSVPHPSRSLILKGLIYVIYTIIDIHSVYGSKKGLKIINY